MNNVNENSQGNHIVLDKTDFNVLMVVDSPLGAERSTEYILNSLPMQSLRLHIFYITDLGYVPEMYNPLSLREWLGENSRKSRNVLNSMREKLMQRGMEISSMESAVGNPSILLPRKIQNIEPDLIIAGPSENGKEISSAFSLTQCAVLIMPDERNGKGVQQFSKPAVRMTFSLLAGK